MCTLIPIPRRRTVGSHPLLQLDMPSASLAMRFDVEGGSYETNTSAYSLENGNNEFILPTEATGSDSRGCHVRGREIKAAFPRIGPHRAKTTPFLISKKEATNQEYALFLNSESYSDTALWDCPVVLGGVEYGCEDLLSRFVDETTLPVRHTGNTPTTRGVRKITGTAFHGLRPRPLRGSRGWPFRRPTNGASPRACGLPTSLCPKQLFQNQLQVVGDEETENQHGLLDIAGNVREWASNSSGDGGKAVGGCYWTRITRPTCFTANRRWTGAKGSEVVEEPVGGRRFAL